MKPVLVILTLTTLALSIYFTYNRYDYVGVHTMRMYDGNHDKRLSTRGTIRFNDSGTAIESISKTGFLKYSSDDVALEARFKDGQIVYKLTEDGDKINTQDIYGRELLAKLIAEVLETGYDARGRAERVYAKGGATALMNTAASIQQEHVKSTYYEYLLNTDTLNTEHAAEIVSAIASFKNDYEKARLLKPLASKPLPDSLWNLWIKTAQTINADYEKAAVLKAVLSGSPDSTTYDRMLQLTSTIGSDFEKANVLKSFLKQNEINNDNLAAVLSVVKSVNTDYEKSNLLREVTFPLNDSLAEQAYFSAVSSIGSDYEKTRALERLLEHPITTNVFNQASTIASGIQADHEKANVLKKLIDKAEGQGRIPRLMMVVHDMGSEYEKATLIRTIGEKNPNAEEDWMALITEATFITNDAEKSNLLVHLSRNLPKTANTQDAYVKAARSIKSEYEYGKALKAIDF
ncbi:MAG: hypothetical protein EOO04_04265 [Chitinophagaceae bacterium]|nr:MAG: hypothetical protein EOO04_04265 [Chitinophagaceae bacterium]